MENLPICFAASVAIAVLAACSPQEEQAATERPVQTFVLGVGAEAPFRSFPGEVSASDSVELSFDVSGRLMDFPAAQGMIVSAGDLLGILDPENFEADVQAANARFNNARDELARRRPLRESGAISESQFDQSVREFEVTTAALQTARRALEDTKLKAPFDGRVARTLVSSRENIRAKQPVLVFQNLAQLEIDIQVPESDMLVAEHGLTSENARNMLEAGVEFATLPGKRFDIELKSFSTEATLAARTFKATFLFDPPGEHNILPGMTCSVKLRWKRPDVAAEDGVFMVPVGSVVTADNRTWVWKINPESMSVSRLEVEMVAKIDDMIKIRSNDLQGEDELVASGARFLSEGMTVRRMR